MLNKIYSMTCQKFLTIVIVLSIVLLSIISGCGKGGETPSNTNTPRIGLITGESGLEDPYYKKAWEGLQKAEQDLKVGIGYVEAKNDKDYPSKLAELRNEKYDMIITIGSDGIPAVLEAAKDNPKTKYLCLDSTLDNNIPPNVLGMSYKVEEASFLAGYLAGKMTKSYVVGFISGDNKEKALEYYYGYKAGLRSSNSGCELMKGIAGTFTNKKRLEEMTERMLESKADVIFHYAGTAGKSMIKLMDNHDKYAIGADVDQNYLAPKSVITSVVKKNDQVLYEIIKDYKAKKLVFGKVLSYGLAENAVGLAESTESMVPDSIYKLMSKYEEKIIEGKLKIPSNENEYLKFVDN